MKTGNGKLASHALPLGAPLRIEGWQAEINLLCGVRKAFQLTDSFVIREFQMRVTQRFPSLRYVVVKKKLMRSQK